MIQDIAGAWSDAIRNGVDKTEFIEQVKNALVSGESSAGQVTTALRMLTEYTLDPKDSKSLCMALRKDLQKIQRGEAPFSSPEIDHLNDRLQAVREEIAVAESRNEEVKQLGKEQAGLRARKKELEREVAQLEAELAQLA